MNTGRVGDPVYNANLERTVRELQRAKDEAEAALKQVRFATLLVESIRTLTNSLNQLRETTEPVRVQDESRSAQMSMEIMTKAYRNVAESEPFLPFPGSVLPALLALRKTHQVTTETNQYIDSQKLSLEQVNGRLEGLRADVKDQLALRTALEKRAQVLRDNLENRMETTPEQLAKEQIAEHKGKKAHYDRETSRLLKSLNWFIKDHLGPLLAAEELGGPVVGDLMEVDSEELGAGFSAQGKLKKAKGKPDEDKRQRRIDDIWGPRGGQPEQAGKRKRENDEASAAGVEMRDLTEQLLNKLAESGGDSSSAYVQIARESAAARFLVRSKVAVFHPRDATRIRLVDFGREIED